MGGNGVGVGVGVREGVGVEDGVKVTSDVGGIGVGALGVFDATGVGVNVGVMVAWQNALMLLLAWPGVLQRKLKSTSLRSVSTPSG